METHIWCGGQAPAEESRGIGAPTSSPTTGGRAATYSAEVTGPGDYGLRRRWYKQHRLKCTDGGEHDESGQGDAGSRGASLRVHSRLRKEAGAEAELLLPLAAGLASEELAEYRKRRAWFHGRCRRLRQDLIVVDRDAGQAERLGQESPANGEATGRFRALGLLVLVVCFGLATWFSSTAVLPQLVRVYGVGPSTASLLTLLVNLGFFCGALASSATGLPDRLAPQRLMAAGTFLAALSNAALLLPGCTFGPALLLRFVSGAAMALVYPIACKLVTTWFVSGRGGAMGCTIGAVVLGSAFPHLINATVPGIDWRVLVAVCSATSALGGVLALLLLRPGPHLVARRQAIGGERERTTRGSWREVLANRELVCAILAYSGHNWELFGVWSSYKAFALQSVSTNSSTVDVQSSSEAQTASAIAFGVIAMGAAASAGAGWAADHVGRTKICLGCSIVSGLCTLFVGNLVESRPAVLVLGLVWGFTVVGDSAQYSAMVSEVADPARVGACLTLQFAVGFATTMPPMYLIPLVAQTGSWGWALRMLTPGALLAVAALLRLRRLPRARLIAGGKM